MIPIDPAVFLHPAEYHDGGVAFFPVVALALGVGLFAFGAWQLYRTTRGASAGASGQSGAAEARDSSTDR